MKVLIFITIFQIAKGIRTFSDKLDIQESQSCFDFNCEFCCLSTNQCGSLQECKERRLPILFLEGFYYTILFICVFMLLSQIYNKGRGANTRT